MHTSSPAARPRTLHVALWIFQILAAAFFAYAAIMKMAMPIPRLAAMWPWTGELPVMAVRSLGVIDLLGALGLVLPGLTRIRPGLTVTAAACCVLLQLCAIAFHASRGEFMALPVNFITITVCLWIWWGRSRVAPLA